MALTPEFLEYQQKIEREMHSVWMPHAGQVDIAMDFFYNWVQGVFMRCGRKFGKALCLDTPILTPSGFKRMGDIESGDTVFDERGREQSVLVAHDIIDRPESYRVHFCNGSYIDACADHKWFTWTKADRKNFKRGLSYSPSVKSTLEIFNTQMNGKEYNHSIPYTGPIEMNEKEFPLDPYLLGFWLGDGFMGDGRITTADTEIVEEIRKTHEVTKLSDKYGYYVKGIKVILRELDLLKNKRIPAEYLLGSKEQRLSLLQGLMDSDGTISKKGNHCCFDNTNYDIAMGVKYLVASLGMKPIWKERIPKLNGVEHKRCYRVQFRPLAPVFRLKRKLDRITYNNTKSLHWTIKKVEKIESKPMRCLTVSGKSKLFLSGLDLIPTHNSEFAVYCMYMFGKLFPDSECYYIADEKDHARDILWDNRRLPEFLTSFRPNAGESADHYAARRARGRELHSRWVKKINESEMYVRLDNGSMLKVDGAKNWKKADGLGPIFIVYDEFKNHDPRFDRAARPNLMDLNGRILIIGTPPDNEDNYYCETEQEFMHKPNHLAYIRPSWMNPHVYSGRDCSKLKIEKEALARKGELHVYLREYECQIVPDSKRQIFPMFDMPSFDHDTKRYLPSTRHFVPHAEVMGLFQRHPRDWDLYCCFDAGSATTFAVLLVAINRYSRQILVLDEVYETEQKRMTTRLIYDQALERMEELWAYLPDWTQIYDNAALWFALEVQSHYEDAALVPCTKDVRKKEAKLSLMKDIFLMDRLIYVSDRCQSFASEIGGYAKDDKGNIPKEKDHLIDCIRYILSADMYDELPMQPPSADPLLARRRGFTIEEDISLDVSQRDPFYSEVEDFYE